MFLFREGNLLYRKVENSIKVLCSTIVIVNITVVYFSVGEKQERLEGNY